MASEVDIANLALGHLGDDATVASFDPPEGSPQAEHCAHFYPIARDTLLEEYAWTFATVTEPLVLLGPAVDGWTYSYALPNLCLKVLSVYTPGNRNDDDPLPFELETMADGQLILLTDVPNAIIRYTRKITDSSRFSPLFTETLSWLLASMLAGPILKGDTGVKAGTSAYQIFIARLGRSTSSDANKNRVRPEAVAPWIEGR